ncbi:MAG: type II toxin-antitoxin system CcdA family antitoxin [Candidatus Devosia phytovorans]|uniref:Type II toxin-antitoxin system CcdA family antitoxin n=1 Tax=Candidatus Devosia phytovorans TaxID=3121372 RepID=A0AAJ5VRS8_9HYPH|nr:type II toxin-antitoxin system CcdA family antitoxin [Devosia sp.]WEK02745.1 MAG: type II toxin-antitoxin system CcdA family antitoxin [Devosia sp.]
MANALPKTPRLTRDDYLRILDLPSKAFRDAKASMSEAEVVEMRKVWLEDSKEAIADYNRHVEEHGLPLEKYRLF